MMDYVFILSCFSNFFFPLLMVELGMTAPQAAGVIHSDFEKGFIRAETVSNTNLIFIKLSGKISFFFFHVMN